MKVSEDLKRRALPKLLSREKMVEILQKNEYGYIPDIEYSVEVSEPVTVEKRYCAGAVQHSYVNMTISTEFASHTFRINRMLHVDGTVNPFFINITFSPNTPNSYYPAEEVADNGFDVLTVAYEDITTDDNDFSNGIAKVLLKDGQRNGTDCGKIMMWAWVISRILDYAYTLPMLDKKHAAVVGHSRLGKTALVASMMDTRFRYAFSNNSGCSGAGVARGAEGLEKHNYDFDISQLHTYNFDYTKSETIRDIVRMFPFFFCKNYFKYTEPNIPDAFDQHYLIASIAPRFAYVASASGDLWASPDSEFISCVAASEAYEELGFKGILCEENMPGDDVVYPDGRIGYHRRIGPHFLSRHDWARFMAFIKLHLED